MTRLLCRMSNGLVCFICMMLFISSAYAGQNSANYLDVKKPIALLKLQSYEQLEAMLDQLYQAVLENPAEEYRLHYVYRALAESYSDTESQVSQWVKIYPQHYQARLVHAAQKVQQAEDRNDRHVVDVYKDFKFVFSKHIDHPVAHYYFTRQQCFDMGARCASKIIAFQNKRAPDVYFARRALLTYLRTDWGGEKEAIEDYLKAAGAAIKAHPYWQPLLGYENFIICHAALRKREYEQARVECEKAVSFGADQEYSENLAKVLMALGRFSEAEAVLTTLKDTFPSNYWDLLAPRYVAEYKKQGEIFAEKGQNSLAIQAYSAALRLKPDDASILSLRGSAYGKQRQWVASEQDLRFVLAQEPDNFKACIAIDAALAYQERFAEIVPFWEAYIKRNPKKAEAYYELAGTYHHLGEQRKSRLHVKKACDLGLKAACRRIGK